MKWKREVQKEGDMEEGREGDMREGGRVGRNEEEVCPHVCTDVHSHMKS